MNNFDKIIKEAAESYIKQESLKIYDIPETKPSLKFKIRM